MHKCIVQIRTKLNTHSRVGMKTLLDFKTSTNQYHRSLMRLFKVILMKLRFYCHLVLRMKQHLKKESLIIMQLSGALTLSGFSSLVLSLPPFFPFFFPSHLFNRSSVIKTERIRTYFIIRLLGLSFCIS